MTTHLLDIVPNWDQFINLIDKIIWPLTVLAGLLFFRKHLAGVINSLGSIKAGVDGFEMTFQNQLEDVKELIGVEASGGISKAAGQINITGSRAETPYEQLLELRDMLNHKIVAKAIDFKIPTEQTSSQTIIDQLKDVGAITLQTARNTKALIKLTNAGTPAISQSQVNQVRGLVNALQF